MTSLVRLESGRERLSGGRRSLLRWIALGLWLCAAVLLGRLLLFAIGPTLMDAPVDFDEFPGRLERGWSLGVAAAIMVATGIVLSKATASPDGQHLATLFVVAVALMAAVGLIWSLRATERPPNVATSPDPSIPGRIAWVEPGPPPCIWSVAAGGGEPTLDFCADESAEDVGADLFGWSPTGQYVMSRFGVPDLMLVFIDPNSGEETAVVPASWLVHGEDDPAIRDDGARLVPGYWWLGAEVRVEQSRSPTAVTVRGPHDYTMSARWSPDGEWILLRDSRQRLLVSPSDRDDPRILVEGHPVPGWQGIGWHIEGNSKYAITTQLPSDRKLCEGHRYASLTCVFDYSEYAGDMVSNDVRALLLVLDDEYLFAAIIADSEEPAPPSFSEAAERNTLQLELFAQMHEVGLPPNPWSSPAFYVPDLQAACRHGGDQTRAEQHLIEELLRTVADTDLRDLLTTLRGNLDGRIATMAACA